LDEVPPTLDDNGIGAKQDALWDVAHGQVRVLVALNEMEPVLGHVHQQGAWFGESELLLGVPGLVEMQAAGEVTLVRVPFVEFRRLAKAHAALWEALARLTSMNQVLAMTAANDLALRRGREKAVGDDPASERPAREFPGLRAPCAHPRQPTGACEAGECVALQSFRGA